MTPKSSFQMEADTEEKIADTSKMSRDEPEKPVTENKSRSVLFSITSTISLSMPACHVAFTNARIMYS